VSLNVDHISFSLTGFVTSLFFSMPPNTLKDYDAEITGMCRLSSNTFVFMFCVFLQIELFYILIQ